MTYRFETHSEYYYLTDRNRPGGVLAFDPGEGWVDFVAPVTASDRLWSGVPAAESEALTTDDLEAWLADSRWAAARVARAVLPRARSSTAGSPTSCASGSAGRRPKDAVELERMRVAQRATSAAFAAVAPLSAGGRERASGTDRTGGGAFRHGAEAMAYDTIVGGGVNSAVLHFASEHRGSSKRGELVLIDAGAQYLGYASDITRTYPIGGRLHSDAAGVALGGSRGAPGGDRPLPGRGGVAGRASDRGDGDRRGACRVRRPQG